MSKFRNVRVKMKGGKSRIQRAMVMASGKLKFVKNIHRSASRGAKPSKHYGGRKHMARRRGRKGSHRGRNLTLGITSIGIGAGGILLPQNQYGQPLYELQNHHWGNAAAAALENAKANGLFIGGSLILLALAKRAVGNPTIMKLGNVRIAAL